MPPAILLLFVVAWQFVATCHLVANCCHMPYTCYLLWHAMRLLFIAAFPVVSACHTVAIFAACHTVAACQFISACYTVAICIIAPSIAASACPTCSL